MTHPDPDLRDTSSKFPRFQHSRDDIYALARALATSGVSYSRASVQELLKAKASAAGYNPVGADNEVVSEIIRAVRAEGRTNTQSVPPRPSGSRPGSIDDESVASNDPAGARMYDRKAAVERAIRLHFNAAATAAVREAHRAIEELDRHKSETLEALCLAQSDCYDSTLSRHRAEISRHLIEISELSTALNAETALREAAEVRESAAQKLVAALEQLLPADIARQYRAARPTDSPAGGSTTGDELRSPPCSSVDAADSRESSDEGVT